MAIDRRGPPIARSMVPKSGHVGALGSSQGKLTPCLTFDRNIHNGSVVGQRNHHYQSAISRFNCEPRGVVSNLMALAWPIMDFGREWPDWGDDNGQSQEGSPSPAREEADGEEDEQSDYCMRNGTESRVGRE